jgi:diguanylate cyclase (GGDEF)-like protein
MKSISPPSSQVSLRLYYSIIAIFVVLVLLGGSIFASLYVSKVSRDNTRALQLQNRVSDEIAKLRNAIWLADNAINALLNNPQPDFERTINKNLQQAEASFNTLRQSTTQESPELTRLVQDFETDFQVLKDNILELIDLRQDPEWIYPMSPFINQTLLESNREFVLAANLALFEIESNDGARYATRLYRLVDEARDLWRELILNFRASIILFASLNTQQEYAQEDNIRILHRRILEKLDNLEKMKDEGLLGFETELALETMQFRARQWYQDYLKLKKLRKSNRWRADLEYLDTKIRPMQAHVFTDLTVLEKEMIAWSSRNTALVGDAANKINLELWGLSTIAITLMLLVYYMLHRLVLSPLAKIAETISTEGRNIEDLSLPGKGSREIHTLINSFNALRRQIHQRQIALQHQSLTDSLTGLPNRALLQDRLEQAIHMAHRQNTNLAVLLLDLDQFKEINDTLGHPTGDNVLQQIASRLLECIGEADTVARLGGDEFAIIVPDTNTGQVKLFAQVVNKAVNQVVRVEKHKLYVAASIGIAMFPGHGTDPMTLIRHADIAMYSAKRNNRVYIVYDPSLDEQNIDNLSLLGDLSLELEKPSGQIQLYYQPQIDLFRHTVIGVEALLRWEHPVQGYVPPELVVNLAEKTGLITELSNLVLRIAISDCAGWQREHPGIKVSVNLSAMNLQDPTLPTTVRTLLIESEIDAGLLTLEITESAVMSDPVRAREVLQVLSLMGVDLVIDDYGTGFSSLAYLKLLPVSSLKIDKSFVIEMQHDENDTIIVHSTIDLAHNLGLTVIAEGVEHQQAALMLRQRKCDAAQGFHFARPMAKSDLLNWLEKHYRMAVT